jgi:GT2 family glycosyltransferase
MLRDCLTAVERARSAVPGGTVDVVVTDDSHDESSHDLVRSEFPAMRYVKGPKRGPASNRNHGAAQTNTSWLIFLDDDCIPDPDWLQAYLAALAQWPSCLLFEGRTRADRPRRSYDEEAPVNETGGFLWSCNMAIRRDLFRQMDGFCESFPYPALEDVDLRMRLSEAGYRATFLRDACVCHPYRPMRDFDFIRKHTASYAHLLQRHPTLRQSLSWDGVLLNTARVLLATAKAGSRYGLAGTGRVCYAALAKAWVEVRCLVGPHVSAAN